MREDDLEISSMGFQWSPCETVWVVFAAQLVVRGSDDLCWRLLIHFEELVVICSFERFVFLLDLFFECFFLIGEFSDWDMRCLFIFFGELSTRLSCSFEIVFAFPG